MAKVGDAVYMRWPNAPELEQRRWVPANITAVHDENYVDLDAGGSPRNNVVHHRAATPGEREWLAADEITAEQLAFKPPDVEPRYRD